MGLFWIKEGNKKEYNNIFEWQLFDKIVLDNCDYYILKFDENKILLYSGYESELSRRYYNKYGLNKFIDKYTNYISIQNTKDVTYNYDLYQRRNKKQLKNEINKNIDRFKLFEKYIEQYKKELKKLECEENEKY